MSESPLEPEATPDEQPEIVPSSDPDGGSTIIPEPGVTNPDAV